MADIISHLGSILPEYYQKILPPSVFSATYIAAQLDLQRSRMRKTGCDMGKATDVDHHFRVVDRDLHIIMNPVYTNIRKARDVEEFKRAFLDCLECKQ